MYSKHSRLRGCKPGSLNYNTFCALHFIHSRSLVSFNFNISCERVHIHIPSKIAYVQITSGTMLTHRPELVKILSQIVNVYFQVLKLCISYGLFRAILYT